jgi:hypothetical protein
MDDLEKLNRSIAVYWLGNLGTAADDYVAYVSTCIGLLTHSAMELAERLKSLRQRNDDSLQVARLNHRYLRFARLAAKEVAAGRLDMLVRLGITLEQAKLLRELSDEDIDRLAFGWDGPIIRFVTEAFDRGAMLHIHAGRHHATGIVAARFPGRASW